MGNENLKCNAFEQLQTVCSKQLMLNGCAVIEHCTTQPAGAVYIEEQQLIFVKTGTLKFTNGKTVFEIGKHQSIVFRRNIWIEFSEDEMRDSQELEYFVFTIKHDLVKEFIKLVDLTVTSDIKSASVIVANEDKSWLPYIQSLEFFFKEYEKPQPGLIKLKIFELLFYLAEKKQHLLGQVLDIREHYRVNITSTVEDNITNTLSMEQLAVLSGRSLSSFRRDFLAIYNMPPAQWIRLKRMEKAKEMMLATTMTITDICYTLGFESIAHFSRLFKSYFGAAPTEYKSRAKVA